MSGRADAAGLPKSKITRIRYYKTPGDAAGRPNTRQPLCHQSTNVVLVETDSGLTGVGEGGALDTIEQCAGLIGDDPFRARTGCGSRCSVPTDALGVPVADGYAWELDGKIVTIPEAAEMGDDGTRLPLFSHVAIGGHRQPDEFLGQPKGTGRREGASVFSIQAGPLRRLLS